MLAASLFAAVPHALAQPGAEELLRNRFAELITKSGEERCAEVSHFEPHERDSIYEQWDARCISGREYRILLPLLILAEPEGGINADEHEYHLGEPAAGRRQCRTSVSRSSHRSVHH